MSDMDVGYVAGILDARAHIEVYPSRIRVRVTTRRTDLLEWLANRTGVGIHADERGYDRRGCSEHCEHRHQHIERQSAYWNVDGLRAAIILAACLPWLVDRRYKAIRALRAFEPFWPSDIRRSDVGAAMLRAGWPAPDLAAIRELAA
jgi:hypothetical protein